MNFMFEVAGVIALAFSIAFFMLAFLSRKQAGTWKYVLAGAIFLLIFLIIIYFLIL